VRAELAEVGAEARSILNNKHKTMPYMYILECADGSFYTGSTKNLPRRLWQHQNGLGANHTKKRLPVKLVYAEAFDHVADAFCREKQVQGWSRSKKLALIHSDWNKLPLLAECQNASHHQYYESEIES
jgi:putative endonuclease